MLQFLPHGQLQIFLNAIFPIMVSSAVAGFCKYTKPSREAWSTNIVAYLYLLVVSLPVIWAINPGVGETSWSTDTTFPGVVGVGWLCCLLGLERHRRLVAFAYMHAEQIGIRQ